jgi:hypothetical protein
VGHTKNGYCSPGKFFVVCRKISIPTSKEPFTRGFKQLNRYRLVWAEPKTHATSAILYLIKLVSYHFTMEPPCFYDTNRKPLEKLSNGILVDVGVQKFLPNHPFPLQNPGIAASDRCWPSPPRNPYPPQFGSSGAVTIPLIHSWYGPLVEINKLLNKLPLLFYVQCDRRKSF